MNEEAQKLVDRHIAAFNSQDVDALLADFTSSSTWVTGDYAVPEGGLREFFTSAMESLTPQLSLHRIIDGGDTVAAELNETWTDEGIEKSAGLIAVFDLVDGRIVHAKIYREGSADA